MPEFYRIATCGRCQFFVSLFLSSLVILCSTSKSSNALSDTAKLVEMSLKDPQQEYHTTLIISAQRGLLGLHSARTTNSNIDVLVYDVLGLALLQEKRQESVCPVFSPWTGMSTEEEKAIVSDGEIYVRRQLLPVANRPRSFVVHVSSQELPAVLAILEGTLMNCPQKVDLGLLQRTNRFVFVVDPQSWHNDTDILFGSWTLKSYLRAAVIAADKNYIKIATFNQYRLPQLTQRLLTTDSLGKGLLVEEFFETEMLGADLKVLATPFAQLVQADFLSEEDSSPNHRLYNYQGLVVDLWSIVGEKLGANIRYVNAEPVFEYGRINSEGHWTGSIKAIKDDLAELTLDWALEYFIHQVLSQTPYGPQEYESFATPLYRPASQVFAFLRPFNPTVWLLIALSTFLMSMLMYLMGLASNGKLKLVWWNLVFYCFTCVMGEGKSNAPGQKRARAGNMLSLGSWLLCCAVLGFAYSSTLKSELLAPEIKPSLNTLEEVVESDLPVKMMVWDDQFNKLLSDSDNSLHRRLWQNKVALEAFPTTLNEVVRGEAIYYNWRSQLRERIELEHSTSDGKPTVHLSSDAVLFKSYLAVTYNDTKPWVPQMKRVLSHLMDTGLLWHLEERAWRRLRSTQGARRADMAELERYHCVSCPLRMEHYLGAFAVYATFAAAATAGFILEIMSVKGRGAE